MLATDPTAALAALDVHKSAFPSEQFGDERRPLETLVRAVAEEQRRAREGGAPVRAGQQATSEWRGRGDRP